MNSGAPAWLWIALTVGAAFAQTFRNAAQRHLTATLGTLGATLVRFLYGLPFTLVWLAAVAMLALPHDVGPKSVRVMLVAVWLTFPSFGHL